MRQPSLITRRAAIFGSALCTAATRQTIEQVDLFQQGEAGVHTYRIPALVETRKGVLIAMADARHDNTRDLPGRLSLVMRRSLDGGRTWSRQQTIVAPKEGGAGDASLLFDPAINRVWCFHAYGPPGIGFPTAKPGQRTGENTLQFQAIHSDDDGATWSSPPVDLTPQVKDPAWQALFATSGTHFVTSRGRYLVPLVVRNDLKQEITARNAYSDDRGRTWHIGPAIGTGTDESKVLEIPGRGVMQNMRTTQGKRAIAFSQDGGITFGEVTYDASLPDPGCNAGFAVLRKGVVAFTNAASPKQRQNLTVKLSDDGARTWPHARVIHAGPAAYSTVIPLVHQGRNRSIGVLYERGEKDSIERITFARFSEDWVRRG